MPPHPKFNGAFSRKCLSKKGWAIYHRLWCVKSIGTHQPALCINDKNVTYFGDFGVAHIPKKFIEKKYSLQQIAIEYEHTIQ